MRDIDNKIRRMFKTVGREITVNRVDGTSCSGYALIQPLLYKNKIYIELQPSEVGRLDDGCHLYLGPSNIEFSADDRLTVGDSGYVVQRYEKVYLFGKAIYSWAIIRPTVERSDLQ